MMPDQKHDKYGPQRASNVPSIDAGIVADDLELPVEGHQVTQDIHSQNRKKWYHNI